MNKSVCEEVAYVLNNHFYSIDLDEFVMIKPTTGMRFGGEHPREISVQEIANLQPYKRTTFTGTFEKLEYYYIKISDSIFIDILVNSTRNEIWYRRLSEIPC